MQFNHISCNFIYSVAAIECSKYSNIIKWFFTLDCTLIASNIISGGSLDDYTEGGIIIDENDVPGLIDELPIIAVLATQANGRTEVCGAEELRVKECDRIHALCKNLKKMGADIEELQDGFIINGPTPLKGADIETFHDHRIAMAFTIAGLVTNGDVVLDHPECASISFPEFYDVLENLKQ